MRGSMKAKTCWALAHEKLVRRVQKDKEKEVKDWVRKKSYQISKQRKMSQVVEHLVQIKRLNDEANPQREQEDDHKDLPPVFNKRLFATQGNVIITKEARRVMVRNTKSVEEGVERTLTKSELLSMRTVVDGLKLIHKGQDYIKDALSHVVTMENYDAFEYVVKKPWEDKLSCYYIVHGAVEVTYDMSSTESRNVYQPNIIYSHGTGEYLGMVNAESRDEDISPPATVYTKERSEVLRIDRELFHTIVEKTTQVLNNEIRTYFNHGESVFRDMPNSSKEKIFPLIEKQEYPPNKVIIEQGEIADFLFIIRSGRCQCEREVYIRESDITALFYMSCREPDDFFGDECLLDMEPSYARITTTSSTVCYKIPRVAFQVLHKEILVRFVEEHRHEFPPEDSLMDRGYRNTLWNNYKFYRIKETLKEKGKLHYMCTSNGCSVNSRPPSSSDQYKENMYRFIMKGAHYTPFRVKSAVYPSRQTGHHDSQRRRPATAMERTTKNGFVDVNSDSDDDAEDNEDVKDENDVGESLESGKDENGNPKSESKLLGMELARTLEKHYSKVNYKKIRNVLKGVDDKEALLELLDENSELSKHLKKAWETTDVPVEEKEGFMKNGVLVTMKSDDIVRKAVAMAEKQVHQRGKGSKQEEDWDTILQAENNQAKFMMSANKMRINILRDKLMVIDKKRKKAIQQRNRSGSKVEYKYTPSKFLRDTVEEEATQTPRPAIMNTPATPRSPSTKKTPPTLRQRSLEDCTRRLHDSGNNDNDTANELSAIQRRPNSAIVTRREAKLRRRRQYNSQGSTESLFRKSDQSIGHSQNSIIYRI
ncbi:LOW QUALITY PROTEIN: uncharacterized protein LOC117344960 [Pecten maximus]|uniref:LOW QUALITY PROTEIN: uncharacterized protein LOC117344960 n=1 Tax=Pecten maximus TaxID=6579 RepID=UPI0014584D57|nr:LOW QUALITY PROTEIN: uncharacterized protein LOC117344960 [Pecten maximus]